ncbi:MAG TPA: DbpA RNA binding domain-containing protein [Gemmatimonadales bacterium]|nr:DbpA RNA binding domain-containing protein [Gemmatimonadales bacterium]
MTDLVALHLTPPIADALARLGWSADDAAVREVVPTAARGHNVVVVAPPAPAYAGPALAGVLSRLGGESRRRALVLAPETMLDEWGVVAHALARGASLGVEVTHGAARAARRLAGEALDLLVASPDTALALLHRSALGAESIAALVLGWPEQWPDADALTAVMAELPRDAQRVILTSEPARAADLSERYARRALTVGGAAEHAAPGAAARSERAGPVRTASVAWARRAAAVGELLELLDPASLTVWTADRSRHAALAEALPVGDSGVHVVSGDSPEGDAPASEIVVAFDPPTPDRLRQLISAGTVVLLVPPGAEAYVERIAEPRRPIRLPSVAERTASAAAARRAAVAKAVESGRPERALYVLGPLLERYDPVAVAAALYELWEGAAASGAAAVETPAGAVAAQAPAATPATARVWVGVGKNEGATANDLVAVLTKELRVPREQIGRIELRDGYSLVQLPAADAERIAAALTGSTIRRKRVVARLDRGPAREGARPAGRGGPRPPRPPGRPKLRS